MKLWRLLSKGLPTLGMLRVSCYLTCTCCALGLLAARSVRADIGEMGLAAGRQLSKLEDLTAEAETLVVNGARFHHASVYSKEGVSQVLDRFEAECERTPGMLGQGLRAVPPEAMDRLDARVPHASRNAVVRDESDDGGMLACFVGAKPGSLSELRLRLQHFSTTLDLAEFGDLRYTYVVRKGNKSRVITLWTDSQLNLGRMFPARGDAEGTDSTVAPRPPASRRMFTATAAGMPFAVRLYESQQSPEALQKFYERAMAERGFTLPEGASREGTTAFLDREGSQVFVSLASLDGKSIVTLTEAIGHVGTATAVSE